jgi:hypothetical protein
MNGKPIPKQKDLKRKLKKKSVSKLKKELDKVFSEYIRKSHANQKGEVKCYTCPKVLPWKEIQNGHFVSRVYLSTRFEESNCRPQCVGCNIFGRGKTAIFANNLEIDGDTGITLKLYKKSQELTKWGTKDYEAKIEEYKKKLNDLPLQK